MQPVHRLTYQKALHFYHRDEYYFHPVSGQLLALPHAAKSPGKKPGDLNYNLHTGQLLGLGSKTMVFLTSLISVSLPVAGTLLWWGCCHKVEKAALLRVAAPRSRPGG